MDRDLRILNNNKRDATRIVSRKPSSGEGSNGDIAVGDTAKGPMLFLKVKNRWKSLKPRSVPPRQDITFEGGVHLVYSAGVSATSIGWIRLAGTTDIHSSHGAAATNGNDNQELAMLMPYNATIKRFTIRATNGSIPENTTIRLFILKDGETNWDTNSSTSNAGPDSSSSSYAIEASVNIAELEKAYNILLDDGYIIPKDSLIMMFLLFEEHSAQFVANMHLEFHE